MGNRILPDWQLTAPVDIFAVPVVVEHGAAQIHGAALGQIVRQFRQISRGLQAFQVKFRQGILAQLGAQNGTPRLSSRNGSQP